jgi:hypothetical protein
VSLPVGEYLVQAQTFARTGGSDPSKATKKIETFSFDDLPPSTSIRTPSSGLVAATSFVATGTATDVDGISTRKPIYLETSRQAPSPSARHVSWRGGKVQYGRSRLDPQWSIHVPWTRPGIHVYRTSFKPSWLATNPSLT